MTAVALVVQKPKKKPDPAPAQPVALPARAPQSGRASIVAMLFIALVGGAAVGTGCSWFKGEASKAEQAIVDCTTGNLGKLEPLAALIAPAIVGGQIPWSDVGSTALKAGASIGGCFISHVWDDVEAIVAKGGAGSGSGVKVAAPGAAQELEKFRTALHSTAKFKTATGVH
jgi:hypothetical protein